MDLEAALDPLEGADGMLHRLRIESVGEGDGRRGDAVLGIDPSRRTHADVLQHTTRIMEVVVEVPEGVRVRISGVKVGTGIGIVVG